MSFTVVQADAIYDILVEHCGASNSAFSRDLFVSTQTCSTCVEYRFQGAIGFGGKFWVNDERLYVSCYPEEETPKVLKMIEAANTALAEFLKGSGLKVDHAGRISCSAS